MGSLKLREGRQELLENIRPLWERLNEHHRLISANFAGEFAGRSFDDRKGFLETKAAAGQLKIYIASDTDSSVDVGYCIASISGDLGEIDSIFVEDGCRNRGIGDMLINAALNWMTEMAVKEKIITVAVGNDRALSFYRRYGFMPRMMLLKQSCDNLNQGIGD